MLKLDRRLNRLEMSNSFRRMPSIIVSSLLPRPSILTFFMLLRMCDVKFTRLCTASSHFPCRALTKVAALNEVAVDTMIVSILLGCLDK